MLRLAGASPARGEHAVYDAQILILYAATSALNSETEAAFLDTLYPMMKARIMVAIVHSSRRSRM